MSRRKIRSDSESDSEEIQHTSSFKRLRVENGDEDSNSSATVTTVDSTPVSLDEEDNEPLLVGADGNVEGSIVKMVLTNFVTYDYCEIYPGPQMNMIIGPNGTGKSTIVCAIALGLGGAPSLLGRAKNIAEFVKTGQDEASILIELKQVNQRNVIIQRFLKRSNNATSWKVNGKASTQKDVMSIVHGFNIQVDNLCQFLPQDRVAEFAELSPSQLLERTQSATGKSDLHDMQKQLIDWRNEEKALSTTNISDIDQLKNLNKKNAELEKDVLRIEMKQRIEKEIKLLKTQLPLVRYTESRALTDSLIADYNTEKEKVNQANNNIAPIKNAKTDIEKNKIEANKMKIQQEKNHSQAVAVVKKLSGNIRELRLNIESKKKEIQNIEAKLPEREREIAQTERKIEMLERQVESPPENDFSKFETAINEVNREIHEINNESSDLDQKIKEETKGAFKLKENLEYKNKELQQLKDVMKMRYNKLRNDSKHTIEAYEWYRQNKDEFKGRVYGPIILSINIKDSRYAAFVENALGGSRSKLLRTFLFEEKEDYLKFSHYTADIKKWDVSCSWPDHLSDDVLKTPISKEDLKARFDMDYFVSDLIEAHPFVLKALCMEKSINRYPVALQCSKETQLVNAGVFQKFSIGRSQYNVKTSQYGNKAKQTTTSQIRRAEFLGEAVDTEAQDKLKDEMRMIQANMQDIELIVKDCNAKKDALKRTIDELRHKKEDLTEQKRDVQRQVQRYNIGKTKLKQLQSEVIEMKKKPEEDRRAIEALKEEIHILSNKEDVVLEQYVTSMSRVTKSYEDRLIASMQYFYLEEKFSAIRNFERTHSTELQEATERMEIAKNEYKIAEHNTKKYMEECMNAGRGLPEDLLDDYRQIVRVWKEGNLTITRADLEKEISAKEGEYEGIHFANPNAMKHYDERKTEIANLEQKIAGKEAALRALSAKITELKNKWAPLVKQLVARINTKFSAAFNRINCVGEVQVDEHEDFDKWGINIYVKFRNSEKLQLLTGQRQSGGERSVTTILYLMSLQDLAKSPFRVVDEINQGMDPRNERMIHEQIVQGASRPGTSQYFLITPKLLPDLYYNERIRILCIYNSEWLPRKIKPISAYLENQRETQAN